jgi:hypothetical protein
VTRTTARPHSAFALLPLGGGQLLSGGADRAIRCWEPAWPERSYQVGPRTHSSPGAPRPSAHRPAARPSDHVAGSLDRAADPSHSRLCVASLPALVLGLIAGTPARLAPLPCPNKRAQVSGPVWPNGIIEPATNTLQPPATLRRYQLRHVGPVPVVEEVAYNGDAARQARPACGRAAPPYPVRPPCRVASPRSAHGAPARGGSSKGWQRGLARRCGRA